MSCALHRQEHIWGLAGGNSLLWPLSILQPFGACIELCDKRFYSQAWVVSLWLKKKQDFDLMITVLQSRTKTWSCCQSFTFGISECMFNVHLNVKGLFCEKWGLIVFIKYMCCIWFGHILYVDVGFEWFHCDSTMCFNSALCLNIFSV